MRPADIAGGIDVFLGGPLPAVHDDATPAAGLHFGVVESQPGGGGFAAEGVEKVPGAPRHRLAAMREGHGEAAPFMGDPPDAGAGEKLDPLVAEGLLQHAASLGGMIAQNVRTALDEHHAGTDAMQELRELAGHDAAAEHDHARRDEIKVEHVVTRPEWHVPQARQRRHADLGAGGDEEASAAQPDTVCQFNGVGIDKPGVTAIKIKTPRGELLDPMGGEGADDPSLPGLEGRHVRPGARNPQAEGPALPREVQHLGTVQHRFRRHAAAQDAQPAEGLRAVNDGDPPAERRGDPRRVETGAAAADDDELVWFHRDNMTTDFTDKHG